MTKRKLQAIFFDLDETLYHTSEFTRNARLNAVRAMINLGLNVAEEELYNELGEVVTEFSSNYDRHFNKLLLRFPASTYHNINPTILVASAVIAYHETKHAALKPYPDALEFIEKIYQKNIICGIITAGLEVKQCEKLLRLKLYSYFNKDAIFITDQIGISKPNPKLYKHVCQTLGLAPEECIYVGDHPIKDIAPANKINMITVHIRRGKYSHLKAESPPDYKIDHYSELAEILDRDFDIG